MPSEISQLPTLGGVFSQLDAGETGLPPLPPGPRRGTPSALPADIEAAYLDVDWPTVVRLRKQAAHEIGQASQAWLDDNGTTMPDADRRVRGRSIIRAVVHAYAESLSDRGEALWPLPLENRYVEAVENAIFGYGRLQPLFEIDQAENIEINGCDSVMIQYGDGTRVEHPPVADSDAELIEAIRFLGETASPPRPFDDAHPTMTLALGDRFRLHAIGFGLSYRPSVIIRQHILTDVTLKDLADGGMLPQPVARFLALAVKARKSMVVSGDQGAGKTTLLRALIDAIPETERFGTLETDYELLTHLQPRRRNILALQAKIGLGENTAATQVGAWSVADLIPEALRQNLSRLIVGEVRGSEAGAMFEAMAAGAGTLSTTHSHSASATIDRLAARVAQGGVLTVEEAMRQVAHNISLLIHVELEDDTWRGGLRRRRVTHIRQLTGSMEAGRPSTHLVYRAPSSIGPEVFQPDPAMLQELAPFERASSWQ